MTRDEKVEAIVLDVDNWDLDNLIGYVQHHIRSDLSGASDEQVDSDYEDIAPPPELE